MPTFLFAEGRRAAGQADHIAADHTGQRRGRDRRRRGAVVDLVRAVKLPVIGFAVMSAVVGARPSSSV